MPSKRRVRLTWLLVAFHVVFLTIVSGCGEDAKKEDYEKTQMRKQIEGLESEKQVLKSQLADREGQIQKLTGMLSDPMKEAAKWEYCFWGGVFFFSILGLVAGVAIGSKARQDHEEPAVPTEEVSSGE